MVNRIALISGGILNLFFALFHLTFPWLLRWPEDLGNISAGNKAVLYTAHVWIIFTLLAYAYISLFRWRDLLTTTLGMVLMLTIFFLWFIRAGAEILFFRLGEEGALWRVIVFLILSGLYLMPVIRKESPS